MTIADFYFADDECYHEYIYWDDKTYMHCVFTKFPLKCLLFV